MKYESILINKIHGNVRKLNKEENFRNLTKIQKNMYFAKLYEKIKLLISIFHRA